jgi:hypothetical protein
MLTKPMNQEKASFWRFTHPSLQVEFFAIVGLVGGFKMFHEKNDYGFETISCTENRKLKRETCLQKIFTTDLIRKT